MNKNLLRKKALGPNGFTSEFCQILNEEMTLSLHNLFKKTEAERTLLNSFYEKRITAMQKQDEEFVKKEN